MPITLTQLLGEETATVLVADLAGFSALTADLEPAALGLYLEAFYLHAGTIVEKHGGRVVKFLGDGVLAVFLGGGHRGHGLAALAALMAARATWIAGSSRVDFPRADYCAAVASGELLAGEVGTDRVVFWDVIGKPVSLAFRLCALAEARRVPHLVDESVVEGADGAGASEGEGEVVEGTRHRLFHLDERAAEQGR